MPEPGRWADSQDGRRILSALRTYLERWKSAGHDVRELEEYLRSPELDLRGLDYRLRVLLKRINEPWPGEVERLEPRTCPTCGALAKPYRETCTSCGAVIPRPIFMQEPGGKEGPPGTDERRERLAALRSAMRGWEDAGYDVSELEKCLASPDVTPEEIDNRVETLLRTITRSMSGEAARSSRQCPACYADLASKDLKCPSCGARIKPPGQAAPADRCPKCQSRLGPQDRKCPVCGHRLKPWRLFS